MRIRIVIGLAVLPLVLWAALPLVSSGAPSGGDAKGKVERLRQQIDQARNREGVLSSKIRGYSQRINSLQRGITSLQVRQNTVQANLDRNKAELAKLQSDLRRERARLAKLKARLVTSRRLLGVRLREIYKAAKPDVVTVVLRAEGFAELLEHSEFLRRVNDQDRRIIIAVKKAKDESVRTAKQLGGLEARQRKLTLAIQARRDEIASIKGRLANQRAAYAESRAARNETLADTRTHRHELEGELEEANRALTAQLSGGNSGFSAAAGPIRQGSGSLVWPVNGSVTSPFGPRWGRMHNGIDISGSTGTPIRAADSGRVVVAGPQGGYGNMTCVAHSASFTTCYAHQSRYGTSVGASVSRGQVIGYVGCTGHCFGAHLHFETRVNGSAQNPLNYL